MLLSPLARAYRSAIGDLSLTALTALLILFVFVLVPLGELRLVNRHVLEIAFAVILVSGVAARRHQSLLERLFIGAALLAIGLRVLNLMLPDAAIRVVDALVLIAAFGLLGAVTLARTLRPGEITLHRLQGAISAYVLVGLMFAQGFRLVAISTPGAFLVSGAPADYDTIVPRLVYFSMVTLTTLGYGDITPVHPYARSLVMLESLFGVLYPVILISRLVSLEVVELQHGRSSDA
jgi:voltage-gated potassium channel Kch